MKIKIKRAVFFKHLPVAQPGRLFPRVQEKFPGTENKPG